MIAHDRNREISLQRQTAQHVTNRRAELFLFGRGGNRLSEGEISTALVKRLQCLRKFIGGSGAVPSVCRRTFRASRVRELGD